eukprot:6085347-Amphidinium_carterae.1
MTDDIPTLTTTTLKYIAPIHGDTTDDLQRLREMQEVDDDMHSLQDEDRRQREEAEGPEDVHHRLSQQTHTKYMDEMTRAMEARERLERRRTQPPGTAKQLHIRHQALHQLVLTERTKRLRQREAERPHEQAQTQAGNQQEGARQPKTPPQGVRVPPSSSPSLQDRTAQCREQILRYDKKLIEKNESVATVEYSIWRTS